MRFSQTGPLRRADGGRSERDKCTEMYRPLIAQGKKTKRPSQERERNTRRAMGSKSWQEYLFNAG